MKRLTIWRKVEDNGNRYNPPQIAHELYFTSFFLHVVVFEVQPTVLTVSFLCQLLAWSIYQTFLAKTCACRWPNMPFINYMSIFFRFSAFLKQVTRSLINLLCCVMCNKPFRSNKNMRYTPYPRLISATHLSQVNTSIQFVKAVVFV